MATLRDRLAHAWNAFTDNVEDRGFSFSRGQISSTPPDRVRLRAGNERSIISSIYTRLSIDVAETIIKHVRLDDNERYVETIKSGLNNCITVEANMDQAGTQFRQDMAMSLFNWGVIAIVPVDTTEDPSNPGLTDIKTIRVGEVVGWYPMHVMVNVYNDKKGIRQDIKMPKSSVAIIQNPLYSVMNEPNSTLQRLIRKLNLLDAVDEASSSGKLDIIIQLPYTVKSETRKVAAEQRAKDIEFQLKGSKYGVAYTDGTEKITQLNRPAENNMLAQIEYLTKMLYGQLGLTESIFDGTADEATMLNYHNRTVAPILTAFTEAMRRSFLTKTARSQGQSVVFFRDPFKFMTMATFAEIADKLSRNEVVTSNELRSFVGLRPHEDPKADQLLNSNMPQPQLPAGPVEMGSIPNEPYTPSSDVPGQTLVRDISSASEDIPGNTPVSQLSITQ